MDGYIRRLSGGNECRQVGGLPVTIICRWKGTELGFWMGIVVQALDTFFTYLYDLDHLKHTLCTLTCFNHGD